MACDICEAKGVISQAEARTAGLSSFFTGVPCAVCGRVDERVSSNGECRECARRRARKWAKDNPKKANARTTRWRGAHRDQVHASNKKYKQEHPETATRERKKKYSRERQQQIIEAGRPVPSVCEVCGKPPTGGAPNRKTLHFDHDHKTGKFRGWICFNCNAALGHVKDEMEVLRALIGYLERNNGEV